MKDNNKSLRKGKYLLLKAANCRYVGAYIKLGDLYSGQNLTEKEKYWGIDYQKALYWYKKAEDAGMGVSKRIANVYGKQNA